MMMGSYNAAINSPMTLALTPLEALIIESNFLNSFQIDKVPIIKRNDGRKIKNKQNILVNKVLISLFKKIPRYDENVNKGPGIPCDAP